MKRVLSLVLMAAILFGMLPVSASAQVAEPLVAPGSISTQGSNDLGNMLAEKIAETQESNAGTGLASSITDLKIQGNQATVSYNTVDEGILVVALYSEDGLRMLTSGQAQADPEEESAVITFDGEMPAYFLVKAYLMDPVDYAPMSEVYSTPMYTMQMQALLASTVEDYDPSLVLNFDEDNTTNFAVVSTAAKYIEEVEGVNTVLQADGEAGFYQIGNADGQFTQLQPGDVVVYPYGEEGLLLFKVAAISQEDGIVSITAGDMEIEEAFSHLKLEDTADSQDAVWDTENMRLGVNIAEDVPAVRANTKDWDGDFTLQGGTNFTFEDSIYDGLTVSGSVCLKIEAKIAWYVTDDYNRAEFAIIASAAANLKLSTEKVYASPESFELPIVHLRLPLIGGLGCISMTPALAMKLSATITIQIGKIEAMAGYWIENGPEEKNSMGFFDYDIDEPKYEQEGELFIGFSLTPTVEILKSFVFAAQMKAWVGAEISVKTSDKTGASTIHPCTGCYDGDISFVFEVTTSVEIFKKPFFNTKEYTLLDFSLKFADFYLCDEHGTTIAFGECPYIQHKITVVTVDEDWNPIAEVYVEFEDQNALTNEKGIAEFFAPIGEHLVQANYCGEIRKIHVNADKPKKVNLRFSEADEVADIFDMVESSQAADYGKVVDSGYCGEQGENAGWRFYENGILEIFGYGEMANYRQVYYCQTHNCYQNGDYMEECVSAEIPEYAMPWVKYLEDITGLVVREGITYIGSHLFAWCILEDDGSPYGHKQYVQKSNIVAVSLPSTLREIGLGAFYNCAKLRSIQLPLGLEKIGNSAFYDCTSLLRITIPYTVTQIGNYAFYGCESLTGINLPEGLTIINHYMFDGCKMLRDINIPKSVTEIGVGAFSNCQSLSQIELPEGLTELRAYAFADCKALESIVIPAGITELNDSTFEDCYRLKTVTLPDELKTIGGDLVYATGVFDGCCALERIIIPDSVSFMGQETFRDCTSLVSVILPESLTIISHGMFQNCTSLSTIIIPPNVTTIENLAFSGCKELKIITFQGNAPIFDMEEQIWNNYYTFYCVTASAYYPAGNETWTNEVCQSYGGYLSWSPYEKKENRSPEVATVALPASTGTRQVTAGTVETTDVKTAFFTELVPGAQYVLLVLGSPEAENLLSRENLLYIDQKAASEDGTLSFRYLLPQMDKLSYVVACGPSCKDLKDAQITFPVLCVSEKAQAVNPVVKYDGKTLKEGLDYVITGSVSVTGEGTYTCIIHGIGNYTGTVECTYTVLDTIPGDMDTDGAVNNKDVEYLLWYTLFPEDYPIPSDADFNGDGIVNNLDVEHLLWHTLFPEDYPL